MKVPDSSTTSVPPRTHGMRQIRTGGSGLNRQVLLPTPRRRRGFREQVQWSAELAARTVASAHDRVIIERRIAQVWEVWDRTRFSGDMTMKHDFKVGDHRKVICYLP